MASEDVDKFLESLESITMKEQTNEIEQLRKSEMQMKSRLRDVANLLEKAFEKNCLGVLTDNSFATLDKKYQAEKILLEAQLLSIQEKASETKAERQGKNEEVENLKQYTEIKELDRDTVINLIKSIHISEPKNVEDRKCYDVEIRYKFHNKFNSSEKKDFAVLKRVGSV